MFTEVTHKIDSHILTEGDKIDLINMIQKQLNGKVKLTLLYRMSKDGKSVRQFHNLCDDEGATLTVIKSKEYDHIFGGYSSKDWQSNYAGVRVKDSNAFLFLLRSAFGHQQQVFPVGNAEYGIYHDATYGPAFGCNCALAITLDDKQNYDGYISTKHPAFKITGNALCGGEIYEIEKKKYPFQIDDYEVFKVSVKQNKQTKRKEMTWREFLSQTAGNE